MLWVAVFGLVLLSIGQGTPYYVSGDRPVVEIAEGPYLSQVPEKRACIRRGGNCDYRPADCCYSSSCLCNLWGTNCRCQRMGLFQRWGK